LTRGLGAGERRWSHFSHDLRRAPMKIVEVGDHVCKVGLSSQENWELVDQARKGHWFFHLTDFPSPYVVLECSKHEPSAEVKEQCSQICVDFSKQKANKNIKVDVTLCSNVRIDRKDEVGECDYRNEDKVEVFVINPTGDAPSTKGSKESKDAKRRSQNADDKGKGDAAASPSEKEASDKFVVAEGEHVSVKKSAAGGWATVTFRSAAVCEAMLRERQEIVVKGGVVVKLKRQVDPQADQEMPGGVFATWGRKAEEKTPISEKELLRCFEAMAKQLAEQVDRSAPAVASGQHLQVSKAAAGGCAVVTVDDADARNAMLALGTEVTVEPGVLVKLRPQVDPKTKEDIPTAIFAAWGRKVEESSPVSEESLLRCLEALYAKVAESASEPVGEGSAAET